MPIVVFNNINIKLPRETFKVSNRKEQSMKTRYVTLEWGALLHGGCLVGRLVVPVSNVSKGNIYIVLKMFMLFIPVHCHLFKESF